MTVDARALRVVGSGGTEEEEHVSGLLERLEEKSAVICDMDGVVYHGNRLLPGAAEFVQWLKEQGKRYLFLTNASERTPRELREKLGRLGIDVGAEHFYTSALATAAFLASQRPGGTAYVIGGNGLLNALYEAGFSMNEIDPDYVVVGEASTYNMETLQRAINLVRKGARLIGTNPDVTGPVEEGIVPATGALIAPIERATGRKAYFVGKPNPLMMRHAVKRLESRREDTVIIGDRMDTDIVAGIESEIETILVLSGVTALEDIADFPYQPHHVISGVVDIVEGREEQEVPKRVRAASGHEAPGREGAPSPREGGPSAREAAPANHGRTPE
jgi:NagD protein